MALYYISVRQVRGSAEATRGVDGTVLGWEGGRRDRGWPRYRAGHALELALRGASVVVNDVGAAVDGTGTGRDADLTVDLIKSQGGKQLPTMAMWVTKRRPKTLSPRPWTPSAVSTFW